MRSIFIYFNRVSQLGDRDSYESYLFLLGFDKDGKKDTTPEEDGEKKKTQEEIEREMEEFVAKAREEELNWLRENDFAAYMATKYPVSHSGRIDNDNILFDAISFVLSGGTSFVIKSFGRTAVNKTVVKGAAVAAVANTAAKGGVSLTPKITKQMLSRGWTDKLIESTVNNPFTTRAATNKATGNMATAYFTKDGAYVVRDNITKEIIQISNRLDPKWIPDSTIFNPYIP